MDTQPIYFIEERQGKKDYVWKGMDKSLSYKDAKQKLERLHDLNGTKTYRLVQLLIMYA